MPDFRGKPVGETAVWDNFTVPHGEPGNLPDQPGSTATAVFYQTDTNAFLTGSGNIYNLGFSHFRLEGTASYPLGTIVLQTRTAGSELDYDAVSLVCSNATEGAAVAPLYRYELNRGSAGGFEAVTMLWQWDLRGLEADRFWIHLPAAGLSVSFDSLVLDVSEMWAPCFPEQPFRWSAEAASLARWMYPFNGNPAARPTASVFGALGSQPDFDARDAQYLLGWSTEGLVPSGLGADRYRIKRARVTLTIAAGGAYVYTGTLPDYRTYFPTNDPRHVPSTDSSRPVEMFGAGFRGEYTAETYAQDEDWGLDPDGGFYTNRAVYAAGYNTAGELVDVSNNVGNDGVEALANPFEVAPFAVGQSTDVAPGELMPEGSRLTFDLNLDDPWIHGYLQQALDQGELRLVATSLIGATFGGPPTYPTFYTIFSPLADPDQFPLLELEGVVIRPDRDADEDGLPDDWENFHFASLAGAPGDDGDGDGADAESEYRAGTDPGRSEDVFRILDWERHDTGVSLRATFVSGRDDALQWTGGFGSWQTLTNAAVIYGSDWLFKTRAEVAYPSPTYAVWSDTNAVPEAEARFYRLQSTIPDRR